MVKNCDCREFCTERKNFKFDVESLTPFKCCENADIDCYSWLPRNCRNTRNAHEIQFGSNFRSLYKTIYCKNHLPPYEMEKKCIFCIFIRKIFFNKLIFETKKGEFCESCLKVDERETKSYFIASMPTKTISSESERGGKPRWRSKNQTICPKCMEKNWQSNCNYYEAPIRFNSIPYGINCFFCLEKI